MLELFSMTMMNVHEKAQGGTAHAKNRNRFDVWQPEYEALLRRDLMNQH